MDDANSVSRRVSVTHRNFQMSLTKMAELNMTWSSTRYASLSSATVHLCLIREYKSTPSKASLHFTLMWDQWRAASFNNCHIFVTISWIFFFFLQISVQMIPHLLLLHIVHACNLCNLPAEQPNVIMHHYWKGAGGIAALRNDSLCAVVTSV